MGARFEFLGEVIGHGIRVCIAFRGPTARGGTVPDLHFFFLSKIQLWRAKFMKAKNSRLESLQLYFNLCK